MPRGGARLGAGRKAGPKIAEHLVARSVRYDEPMPAPRNEADLPYFQPEYIERVKDMARMGAADADLADNFGVSLKDLRAWMVAKPDFLVAAAIPDAIAIMRVERAIWHRAIGYTYETQKVFSHKGVPVIVTVREHLPPETKAGEFYLNNRARDRWQRTPENFAPAGEVNNIVNNVTNNTTIDARVQTATVMSAQDVKELDESALAAMLTDALVESEKAATEQE